MDYNELAQEFLDHMVSLKKCKPHKAISESVHGEAFILQYISHQQEEVLPSSISNNMQISSARIAAMLNSLENKGYITRKIDTKDRRRILVAITDSGKAQAKINLQLVLNDTSTMLSQLGEEDAKQYVRLTGKLVEIFNNM